MFSMCVVLLVFFSICTVVAGAPERLTGHRGESLGIQCPYELGYESNSKYFCKGECIFGFRNKMVESGSPDTGQYWCGVDGIIFDDYSKILLTVKQDKKTTEVSTISAFSTTPSYFSTKNLNPQPTSITITDQHKSTDLASVAGGLGSVLLVLILCSIMFLILKKRKRKSGTGLFQQNVQHNTENVHMYEIANSDPGPSDVIAAVSSSNQTPASHLNTCPQVPTIYATVTNQQPDLNPHLTNTDSDYYANMKLPEPTQGRTEMIYATATHPQNITTHPQNVKTNEGTIYSVITHE